MVDNNSRSDVVASLDVVTGFGGNILATRQVRRSDFTAANQWQTFTLQFDNPCFALFEARVWWAGNTNMKFAQLTITPLSVASSGVQWLVTDQLGTPRIVFDKTGWLSGVSRHDYLPFGEELYANQGARTPTMGYTLSDNLRQHFTGQERDNETGLDYMHARYYANAQGRFTSADTVAGSIGNPQSFNRYAYVGNNPLNFSDPTGHTRFDASSNGFAETMGQGGYMSPENPDYDTGLPQKYLDEIANWIAEDEARANATTKDSEEGGADGKVSADGDSSSSSDSGTISGTVTEAPQNPTPQTPTYPIAENAAIDALVTYNPTSIQKNLEYAGEICRRLSDNLFIYTLGPANARTPNRSDPGVCPTGTVEDADWHTHAATDPALVRRGFLGIGRKDRNEIFSDDDRIDNNQKGVRGYLATPSGAIKVFTPGAPGQQNSTKGQVRTLRQRTPI